MSVGTGCYYDLVNTSLAVQETCSRLFAVTDTQQARCIMGLGMRQVLLGEQLALLPRARCCCAGKPSVWSRQLTQVLQRVRACSGGWQFYAALTRTRA
jgi:hypothetical protein